MEELEEDFIIEEEGYTINSNGSSFHHCTPECLGPFSSRILALDYSKIKCFGIAVNYYCFPDEGCNAPYLTLGFISNTNNGETKFTIKCRFYCPGDYRSINTKALPDINAFTAFSEEYCSMEVKYYSNYCPSYQDGFEESTITLKTKHKSLEINCFTVEFRFEDY